MGAGKRVRARVTVRLRMEAGVRVRDKVRFKGRGGVRVRVWRGWG